MKEIMGIFFSNEITSRPAFIKWFLQDKRSNSAVKPKPYSLTAEWEVMFFLW